MKPGDVWVTEIGGRKFQIRKLAREWAKGSFYMVSVASVVDGSWVTYGSYSRLSEWRKGIK